MIMWKETSIDGGLLSGRDMDRLGELVSQYLIDNVEDHEPEGDFIFEVKIEYLAKQEK